jgi:hypothetical protein
MPSTVRRRAILATLAIALAAPLAAQETPAASASPPPCAGAGHREFDFWIGEWDVSRPDGPVVGTNRIESILDGCVLYESWTSTGGGSVGHSFNIRARDGRWHQTWVDNSGLLLQLTGGMVEGRMVMAQDLRHLDGTTTRHEISWEPLPSGQVKQHWRASEDGGKTWTDVFVGIYTRKK